MDKRTIQDIKDFFESYEIAHKLMAGVGHRFLSVKMTTSTKGVVLIRVIEKMERSNDNLVCDARIEGNKLSMLFKLNCQAKMITNNIKEIVRPYYKVTFLGSQLKMDIANPTLRDAQETFVAMMPYCRRREE